MSMGTFKFVQVQFTEPDSAAGLLDVEVRLTTMTRRSLRAEMDLVSKSNNFAGPRMNISLQNRNAFGGAEQLNLYAGRVVRVAAGREGAEPLLLLRESAGGAALSAVRGAF
jgi:outer membrane protein assembly factor BamA